MAAKPTKKSEKKKAKAKNTKVKKTRSEEPVIYKGLAGVTVDYTAVSKVMPETNSLTYRGYAVQDLAANCRFEEVAYLMWHGELPTRAQLRAAAATSRAAMSR